MTDKGKSTVNQSWIVNGVEQGMKVEQWKKVVQKLKVEQWMKVRHSMEVWECEKLEQKNKG